jgi:hypothetical protein
LNKTCQKDNCHPNLLGGQAEEARLATDEKSKSARNRSKPIDKMRFGFLL